MGISSTGGATSKRTKTDREEFPESQTRISNKHIEHRQKSKDTHRSKRKVQEQEKFHFIDLSQIKKI